MGATQVVGKQLWPFRAGLTHIEDVVPFIRHLVSDGWWVTGQTILINGGYPRITISIVRDLVRETREKGYCALPGVIVKGYCGLAVPLLQEGRPIAAIVLVTSAARLNATRQAALGEHMRRLALDLMARAEPNNPPSEAKV